MNEHGTDGFPAARRLVLSGTNCPSTDPARGTITLSVHESGGATDSDARPPVVFCHGFPELAYSWRHQISAIPDLGFRVLAPDQRGYGDSTAPESVEAYGLGELCGDLADLLDAESIDKAIFVGHDWGGFLAWAMPVLFPDRCAGVVGICTPYTPFPTTELLRSFFGEDPDKLYMLWFQEPGVAESFMDSRVDMIFEKLMRGGTDPEAMAREGFARSKGSSFNPFKEIESLGVRGDPVLDDDELAVYKSTFTRTGFRGGINWYRNIDTNAQRYPEVGTVKLDLPALMVCAEWDPALPPSMARHMPDMCSDLEMTTIPRAGHWLQQEFPDQVNSILGSWLTARFPTAE